MMTLESTDIRFECHQCGQRLVMEADGAGLIADCPICETSVTVPSRSLRSQAAALPAPEAVPASPSASGTIRSERASCVDPESASMREELIDASLLNGRLERQLDEHQQEVARLQQQLKLATDEAERLTASATHAQAELKSYHHERQQLRADLATARQRFAAVETQQGERESTLADARFHIEALTTDQVAARAEIDSQAVALADLRREAEELSVHLGTAGDQLAGTQRELTAREETLAHRDSELAQRDGELAQLRLDTANIARGHDTEQATMRGQLDQLTREGAALRRQLDEAMPLVEEGRRTRGQLTLLEGELVLTLEKLQSSESSGQSLQTEVAALRTEGESMRRDLAADDTGRELLEVRARIVETEAERTRWQARSVTLEADLQSLRTAQAALGARADAMRHERDEAREDLAAISASKTMQDNEILRGIVARQNSELAQQHGELYRLKRARFALKIAYSLFGLGLLGVVAFACSVIAHVKF